MSRLSEISPKFKDHYFCRLAVSDHLHECVSLFAGWQTEKAKSGKESKEAESIKTQFELELTDLLILLEELIPEELVQGRLRRFAENAERKTE
jgi:hypothetical protein